MKTTEVRPAVCLTDPIGPYRHVILAFITSQIPVDLLDSDVVLDSGDEGFAAPGLRVTSTIRLHRRMTVTTAFIQRELGDWTLANLPYGDFCTFSRIARLQFGELPLSVKDKVQEKLRKLFGL